MHPRPLQYSTAPYSRCRLPARLDGPHSTEHTLAIVDHIRHNLSRASAVPQAYSGTIPTEFGMLSELTGLRLGSNELTGPSVVGAVAVAVTLRRD